MIVTNKAPFSLNDNLISSITFLEDESGRPLTKKPIIESKNSLNIALAEFNANYPLIER